MNAAEHFEPSRPANRCRLALARVRGCVRRLPSGAGNPEGADRRRIDALWSYLLRRKEREQERNSASWRPAPVAAVGTRTAEPLRKEHTARPVLIGWRRDFEQAIW